MCVPDIAYQCHQYADMWAHRSSPVKSLRVMEICWENYHTDVKTARKHHDRGHKHEPATLLQLVGCLQAVESWEKKRGICSRIKPAVHCVAAYGAHDLVAELLQENMALVEEEKTRQKAAVEGGQEMATDEQLEAATS